MLLFVVARADDGLDVAADVEVALDLDAQGVAGGDEVFEDNVDDVLVENLHLAERVDVELEALQLDAAFIRRVLDADDGEVREVRERADGRELGYLEINPNLAPDVLVGEGVERVKLHLLARRRADVESLLVHGGRRGFGRRHQGKTPHLIAARY